MDKSVVNNFADFYVSVRHYVIVVNYIDISSKLVGSC